MALKIRMSRGGRKNLPYYRIVVTDSRSPRDSKFIERLGTYNPLLAQNDPNRVILDAEKIKGWLAKGAQPSERVAIFLGKAGIAAMPKQSVRPNKSAPKAKAQERVKEAEEKARAAAEAAEAAKAEAAAAAAAPAEAPAAEAAPEAAA